MCISAPKVESATSKIMLKGTASIIALSKILHAPYWCFKKYSTDVAGKTSENVMLREIGKKKEQNGKVLSRMPKNQIINCNVTQPQETLQHKTGKTYIPKKLSKFIWKSFRHWRFELKPANEFRA